MDALQTMMLNTRISTCDILTDGEGTIESQHHPVLYAPVILIRRLYVLVYRNRKKIEYQVCNKGWGRLYDSTEYLYNNCRFCFLLLFYFFPSPPIRSGEAFSSVIFSSLSLLLFVFLDVAMVACVCDHGFERSDLCAEIIIIIIIIIITTVQYSLQL